MAYWYTCNAFPPQISHKYHSRSFAESLCTHSQFLSLLCFFHRHHVQAYLVKTVPSAFLITVKMNTNVTVSLATQEDIVKQVKHMDKTVIYFLFSPGTPETPLPWIKRYARIFVRGTLSVARSEQFSDSLARGKMCAWRNR